MAELLSASDMAIVKLIDFALGLVSTREGVARMEWYLFEGEKIQRNYAAIYFRRAGADEVLHRALEAGKIDRVQAFSK